MKSLHNSILGFTYQTDVLSSRLEQLYRIDIIRHSALLFAVGSIMKKFVPQPLKENIKFKPFVFILL